MSIDRVNRHREDLISRMPERPPGQKALEFARATLRTTRPDTMLYETNVLMIWNEKGGAVS